MRKQLRINAYELFRRIIRHLKLGIMACLLSIVTLTPFAILSKEIETIFLPGINTVIEIRTGIPLGIRILLLLYIINLFLFIQTFREKRIFDHKKLLSEYKEIYKKPYRVKDTPSKANILRRLSEKTGVQPPKLYFTEANVRSLWIGKAKKEDTAIVISEKRLNSLAKDEMETIFAHELWKINMNVNPYFFVKSEDRFWHWWFSSYFLLIVNIFFGIVLTIFSNPTFPFGGISGESWLGQIFSFINPTFIILGSLQVFNLAIFLKGISIQSSLVDLGLASVEQQIYYVDAMTALTTGKPQILRAKLVQELPLCADSKEELNQDSIASEPALDLSHYRELLRDTSLKDNHLVIMKNRIKQLHFIENLLFNHVSLRMKTKADIFSRLGLFGLKLRTYSSPFVKAFNRLNMDTKEKIRNYISINKRNFNLMECAASTGLTLTECFIVFVCLLMVGVVD